VSKSRSGNDNSNGLSTVPISSVMTSNVKTADEDQSLYEVCKIMHENNIGSVVIVKGRKETENRDQPKTRIEPIGIITERDIVNKIALKLDPASYRSSILELIASKIMSAPLITILPNGTIRDVLETMLRKNIRRLVVVESPGHNVEKSEENSPGGINELVGIVTDKDIFRAIMSNQDFVTEILTERSFVDHKDLLMRLGENLLGENWKI
jgi:CBS domain-containing protein